MFKLTIAFALLGCTLAGTVQPNYNDDEGRIVGGEPTTIEKFPYQVALENDDNLICGGSIYSDDIIVTAAHCLQSYKAEEIKVRLGSTTIKSGGEVVQVKAFKFHENYDRYKMINDVGVVKLASPVRFTDKIRPIELAITVPKTGTKAIVTGWGTDKFTSATFQTTLQEAEVEIVAMKDCASESYYYGSQIAETMVCAAVEGGGKDACLGDSGGPLAANSQLVGIVSWGNLCARKEWPGVYASVPDLRSWIIENAAKL